MNIMVFVKALQSFLISYSEIYNDFNSLLSLNLTLAYLSNTHDSEKINRVKIHAYNHSFGGHTACLVDFAHSFYYGKSCILLVG
jgi:hypothetical protein